MEIVGPDLRRTTECEAVLRTLPMWFGIENALQKYVADSAKLPTFAVEAENRLVGFLTLREHFPASWEIHCVAIEAEFRGKGLGSRLLAHAESWLADRGVVFLQVKTVAETDPTAAYAHSRRFYEARGFTPIEIFPELWDPWNPALQYIKLLNAP